MKKFALLLPVLFVTACQKLNKAEIMVQGQSPKASCSVPVQVAVCAIPGEGSAAEPTYGVAVLGKDFPFQWNIIGTEEQLKKAAEARKAAEEKAAQERTTAEEVARKAATPDAGVDAGSAR